VSSLRPRSRTRWIATLVIALTLAGLARALLLWAHDPLYAYANSYDQTRYSACFSIYPDRPADIAPEQNSPQAPFEHFRFITTDDPMCYWSSELVIVALTATAWHLDEWLGGDALHSVRVAGALKLTLLLLVSTGFTLAFYRRGRHLAALANTALLAVLFADPGNTLYLNTFYAEWTSLLGAYALLGLLALWHAEPGNRWRFLAILIVAVALATSKIQHIVLPLSLAIALLVLHRWQRGTVGWRAVALLCGALFGAFAQVVQLQRESTMIDSIRQYNRAGVVLTALLPFADDPRGLLAEIGVDPDCAQYSGKRAWQLPGMPARTCAGVERFGYLTQLRVLLTRPQISWNLARHGIAALNPWVAENIGQVEGEDLGEIPPSMVTLGTPLQRWPALQGVVLSLPLAGLLALFARRRSLARERALEFTASILIVMIATLGITLLGDGLADTAKQGHLVVNAALAWLVIVLVGAAAKASRLIDPELADQA